MKEILTEIQHGWRNFGIWTLVLTHWCTLSIWQSKTIWKYHRDSKEWLYVVDMSYASTTWLSFVCKLICLIEESKGFIYSEMSLMNSWCRCIHHLSKYANFVLMNSWKSSGISRVLLLLSYLSYCLDVYQSLGWYVQNMFSSFFMEALQVSYFFAESEALRDLESTIRGNRRS